MAENTFSEITDSDIHSIDFFASPKGSEHRKQKTEKQPDPKPDPEVTKLIKNVEATLTEKKEDQDEGFKIDEIESLLTNFGRIKKHIAQLEKQVQQLKEENKSLKTALDNSKCQVSEKKKTESKK